LRAEDEQRNTLVYGGSIARMTPSNRKDLKRHSAAVRLIHFCAIISGVVKQLKSLPNGAQQIVRLLLPGDFLGRPFGDAPRSSAVAATEVKVCRLSRAVVERLASDSRRVSRWLFENIFDELENAQDRITLLGRMTAEQKIATFLLWVACGAAGESPHAPDSSADLVVEL
jgi:CRP-like cAMP-binding protein